MSEGSGKKVTRRKALKTVLLGGAGLAVGGLGYQVTSVFTGKDYDVQRKQKFIESITSSNNPRELPNIIVILTDDLGYGDISPFADTAISTPNLDKMAAEGAKLTSFYASAPICTPSRAGLLTGRYPVRTLMTDALLTTWSFMGIGHRLLGYTNYGIPEDEIMIQDVLKARGYSTAHIGKWHLGDFSPHLPNDNNFDFFYGALRSNDIPPFEIYRNYDVEIPEPVDQEVLTKNYTKEAVEFINQNKDNPFFLYFAHTFPHIPLYASEEFQGTSDAGLYGDCVEEVDWSVGKVLKALKDNGIDEKTLVIFTSDNGPWYQGNPGPWRGRKRFVYEGGFRVPFIARWPGKIPAGFQSNAMSMNFDIFATCCAVAGAPTPEDRIIDGKNLMPLLTGESDSLHETLYFYWRKKLWAIRDGEWKYHRYHEMGDINPNPWPHNTFKGPYLYHLQSDPSESYSLIDHFPGKAQELANMMDGFEHSVDENIRGWL